MSQSLHHNDLIAYLLSIMQMPPEFGSMLIPNLSDLITYNEDTQMLKSDEIAKVAYWPVLGYTRSYVLVKPEATYGIIPTLALNSQNKSESF